MGIRIIIAVLLLIMIATSMRIGYLNGYEAGYNDFECVDVTDPNQFVRR